MIPTLEQKIGIIGPIYNLSFISVYVVTFIGSIVLLPVIILLADKLLKYLKTKERTKYKVLAYEEKISKHKEKIEKWETLGLFFIVLLPGAGMTTAAILASILKIDPNKSLISIASAGAIVGFIYIASAYGFINFLELV